MADKKKKKKKGKVRSEATRKLLRDVPGQDDSLKTTKTQRRAKKKKSHRN